MVTVLMQYFKKFKTELDFRTLKHLVFGVVIVILICSGVILMMEPKDQFSGFGDALWWAIVTATTVGYGDKYPITLGGRGVALILMFLGIGSVGAITAKFADMFIGLKKRKELGELAADYVDHLIICGWCKRTEEIIEAVLNESGETRQIVLVADIERDPLPGNDLVHFVKGDISRKKVLEKAGIMKGRTAIILNEDQDDKTTIVAALTVESLNPDIYSVAEVSNKENKIHLENANVDEIIVNNEINSNLLIRSALYQGTSQLINELLSNQVGDEIYLKETQDKDQGQTFTEIINKYRSQQGVLVIGIKREAEVIPNPKQGTEIRADDQLIYIAEENLAVTG